ncbi:MAG: GAF domain-containing protein [Thiobacillus sp.]|nr:GAF domain-containing protein [Thiobacillus sp.]
MPSSTLRLDKLTELAGFEVTGQFTDNLYRLTCIVGDLMSARRVSLMLLDTGPEKTTRLRLAALYGELPEMAWKEEVAPGQGIAGQVLASGKSLRVTRIERSAWKQAARHAQEGGSFMACPVPVASAPAGVLNISGPVGRSTFSTADLAYAELAALLVGRAIQMGRLDRLLDSRLAQMAFTLEGSQDAFNVVSLSAHEPDRVAGMLARAFYREMRHCGFSPNQVIHAAGEILSELTSSLNRHKRRIHQGSEPSG